MVNTFELVAQPYKNLIPKGGVMLTIGLAYNYFLNAYYLNTFQMGYNRKQNVHVSSTSKCVAFISFFKQALFEVPYSPY